MVVKGNHDRAIEGGGGYFNEASRAALRWARETLTEEQKTFLASRPLVEREGAVCYVHASAAKPERWVYIDSSAAAKRCADAAKACYTFCGHLHDQVLYFENAQGRMSEFRPFPAWQSRCAATVTGSQSSARSGNRVIEIQRRLIPCSI